MSNEPIKAKSDPDRQPVRALRDATVRVGIGSDWQPSYRRVLNGLNGTTPSDSSNGRKPLKTVADPLPAPRAKITTHEEREFVYTDKSVARCCPVQNCDWGRATKSGWKKRHSTGMEFVVPEVEEVDGGLVEISADDPQELSLSPAPIVAGEDEPEHDEDPEVSEETTNEETM